MKFRKYITLNAIVALLFLVSFIFLANVFSVTTIKNKMYQGIFAHQIVYFEQLTKVFTMISFALSLSTIYMRFKKQFTFGLYKANIKYSIKYLMLLNLAKIILWLFLLINHDFQVWKILLWSLVVIYGFESYWEATLAMKLYYT